MIKLDDIKKENGFKVPDGYFESFPQKMQERVSDPLSKRKPVALFSSVKFKLAFSFTVLILIVGIYSIVRISAGASGDDLSAGDIALLLDEKNYIVDDYIIEEQWLPADSSVDTASGADSQDDYIIEYLLDDNIDEYLLLAEL